MVETNLLHVLPSRHLPGYPSTNKDRDGGPISHWNVQSIGEKDSGNRPEKTFTVFVMTVVIRRNYTQKNHYILRKFGEESKNHLP